MGAMSKKQRSLLFRILAAAAMMAVLFFLPLDRLPWLRFLLYLVPYFTVGHDILRRALKGIRNRQVFDENFLMAAATVGAMALGEYVEGVAVMLFYQIGELFQSCAVDRSRRNINELMDIRPDYANLVKVQDSEEDSSEAETVERVDPEEVETGSVILVKPGEKVPIDGVVIQGSSSLDASALTGESLPLDVSEGSQVLSGSVNMSGVLRVRTSKEFEDSTASRILDLVENAGSRKAKSEQFISRFARWYTPAVCYGALALAVLGPVGSILFLHASVEWSLWSKWVYRALTFLVISCPCAIVVSVPLTFFGGIGGAGSRGILIKGANFMETLARVRTVVFDKTGTLTKGNFAVVRVCPSGETDRGKLLEYAALAESFSSHPISRSLREAALNYFSGEEPVAAGEVPEAGSEDGLGNGSLQGGIEGLDPARVGTSQEISGRGVITEVDGIRVAAGSLLLMQELGIDAADRELSGPSSASENAGGAPEAETGTVVHVAAGEQYLGYIMIADEIRPGAEEAVRDLRRTGVERIVMLTGDSEGIAAHVAARLGIDEYHARLLPQDKVRRVEELLEGGSEPERGAFSESASFDGASSDGASSDGASSDGASSDGASSDGASSDGASSDGASSNGASSDGASSKGVSSKGAFSESASSKGASSKGASSDGASSKSASSRGTSSGKGTLAFVGDGINDAPVLSRADLGIAMGALGSDAAIEAADVVLMDDDPRKIAQAVRLARRCIRIVRENIGFAIGVKVLCLLLGAAGIANMWIAVFADVGVMILCVLNAIRVLIR